MITKAKQAKPKGKKPKPNLYGPNSPSPKKKMKADDAENKDEQAAQNVSVKDHFNPSENEPVN